MALPLPPGLTPPEIAFLCEMELVTVIPRQRMDSLPLLSGPTLPLNAARSTPLPFYLALLLHRQKRANIAPPLWLTTSTLETILKIELDNPDIFSPNPPFPAPPRSSNSRWSPTQPIASPPFLPHNTASGAAHNLPYHYDELSTLLLTHCADSFASDAEVNALRGLLRDIKEVRASKLRKGMKDLKGGGVVSLPGVGALEVAGERGFVVGAIGGLRALGGSREAGRREAEGEGGEGRIVVEDGEEEEGMDF